MKGKGSNLSRTRETKEDRELRVEGERYARAHAGEFASEHADELVKLISTYADVKAEVLLGELRAKFWMEDWKPSAMAKAGGER